MRYPLSHQIRCIQREIAFRVRVYPRRIVSGRMRQEDADREIETMRCVLETLKQIAGTAPQDTDLFR